MPVTDPLLDSLNIADVALVVRPFKGVRSYFRGEIVDTSDWANVDALIGNRTVVRIPLGFDIDGAYTDEFGRKWASEQVYEDAALHVVAVQHEKETQAKRAVELHLEDLRKLGYDVSSLSGSESAGDDSAQSSTDSDEDGAQTGIESVSDDADHASKSNAPESKVEQPKNKQSSRGGRSKS